MSFSTRLNRLLRVLPEGMGALEYTPPSSPSRLMADFYLIQFMQAPVGKRGQVLSQRAEELLRDLQYVERRLVPYLREHLLQKAGYALVRELRHVFDMVSFTPWGAHYEKPNQYDIAYALRQLGVNRQLIEKLQDSILDGIKLLDDLQLEDYLEAARAGLVVFQEGELFYWRRHFGGPLWQRASAVWLQLYQARTLTDATRYIDLLYSLQHNSGQLLNKNDEYREGWLTQLLDLKFRAKEPEELLPYASSYMRQLVPQLLYALYGRALSADYGGKNHQLEFGHYLEILRTVQQRLQSLNYGTQLLQDSLIVSAPASHQTVQVALVILIYKGTIAVVSMETNDVAVDDPQIVNKLVRLTQRALRKLGADDEVESW